ncbi:MAG TPA: hypothetical protein VHN37_08740 [Actinomycetota bacterium]|nr:hypothetical protein [Actinomycetota bacterium]
MKKKLIAIAAAAVAIVPLTGSPASASVTGGFVFECTASLPEFPADAGTGSCGSAAPVGTTSVPSTATGSVAGVTAANQPYALVAAGAGNFSATFDYAEGCLAGGVPPPLGTASGTATVTGLTGVKGGAPTTATATLDFEWVRVGLTAAVTFTDGEIVFSDDTATPLVMQSAVAEAAFGPVLLGNNSCPSGGPLKAVVAGAAEFGA